MEYQTLAISLADKVATITLNRPEARNALNDQSIDELSFAFRELGCHDKVRAIVMAANGPTFCSGSDPIWLRTTAGYSWKENQADAMQLAQTLRKIYLCPKPVVAKVQGDCSAVGLGLVAACDIAVAAQDANFSLSEVKLGLVPAIISTYVIKAMSENAARRYFLTGEQFTAQEAYRIGFLHEVVAADALDAKVAELLKALVTNSPNAIKEAKILVHEVAYRPLDNTLLDDMALRIARNRACPECRDGVQSYLEDRMPGWLR